MRIGYDASSVRPYRSGVGHYAASLLAALSTQFPEREYLVLSHLTNFRLNAANLLPTQRRSFPVKEIWMQLWLPHILERYRPDLCHFTNGIAPLRMKFPYVVTVHDLSLIRHPEWHPWSRRIWMRQILRPSVLGASGILCVSEATKQDLLAWVPADESRIWVIPLGARSIFRQKFSQESKGAILAKYRLSRPFFLYLGNLEPRKNLRLLAQVFRSLNLPGADLVLAGRRAWLWRDIVRELRILRNQGRVHLLDYVPEADLPALYQSALAFVYPSRMEGFGLPVLEAMASGTPVLASRVEPLVSLVGDAGWLAHPEDAREWRTALEEAWRDDEKRMALAARGQERAAQFTWERTARETMKCYEEVLSRYAIPE